MRFNGLSNFHLQGGRSLDRERQREMCDRRGWTLDVDGSILYSSAESVTEVQFAGLFRLGELFPEVNDYKPK